MFSFRPLSRVVKSQVVKRTSRRFSQSTTPPSTPIADGSLDVSDIASTIQTLDPQIIPELTNYPTHLAIRLVEYVHVAVGIPYWEAIVLSVVGIRMLLFPLMVRSTRSINGLALIRPQIEKLSQDFQSNPDKSEKHAQDLYQANVRLLFQKYKVNPIAPLTMPIVQLPVFISYVFGLQNMATFFPEIATGGAWWFLDLTIADSTLILPFINALTFIGIVETSSDQSASEHKESIKWGMRLLSVVIFPATMGYSQVLTVIIITIFKHELFFANVRPSSYFGSQTMLYLCFKVLY